MFEPAKAVVRLGQDHFEFGWAMLEQFGAADGHGHASFRCGIASKYAHWQPVCYLRFAWYRYFFDRGAKVKKVSIAYSLWVCGGLAKLL
jgi:hypothetical protein